MSKYLVTYERTTYHIITIEAASPEDAVVQVEYGLIDESQALERLHHPGFVVHNVEEIEEE